MDTRLATSKVRSQQWAAIIKDRIESGLTVDEYCAQHNLSRTQYYYWLSKARKYIIEEQMPQMVEITPPVPIELPDKSEANIFKPELTLSVGKYTIGINSDTTPELIHRVMEVLSNA